MKKKSDKGGTRAKSLGDLMGQRKGGDKHEVPHTLKALMHQDGDDHGHGADGKKSLGSLMGQRGGKKK